MGELVRSRELIDVTDDPRRAASTVPDESLPVRARLRWALQVAQLAPSIHNTQPWRWRLLAPATGEALIELHLDVTRHLAALDADGRQQEISCGAALGALLIGGAAAGLAVRTELAPRDVPGVLARVTARSCGSTSGAALERLGALRTRRSARGFFSDEPIRSMVIAELVRASALHGVSARRVGTTAAERDTLDHLIALATLEQYEGEVIPAEVRAWTREAGDARRDGVPSFAWERTSRQTADGAMILRDFAGDRVVPGAVERSGAEPYPELLLLSTVDDRRVAHLQTGLALLDVLVAAELRGIAVGHVNQAIEDPGTRVRLAHELELTGSPQLLLRLGHTSARPHELAPRRPLAEVLDGARRTPRLGFTEL